MTMAKLIQRDPNVREWAKAFVDGREPNLTDEEQAAVHNKIDEEVTEHEYQRWIDSIDGVGW